MLKSWLFTKDSKNRIKTVVFVLIMWSKVSVKYLGSSECAKTGWINVRLMKTDTALNQMQINLQRTQVNKSLPSSKFPI